MSPLTSATRLFAYGTLKRGSPIHAQLCRGVIAVEPARVWGRLFELPAGYPALALPDETVIAAATLSVLDDHHCLNTAPVRLPAPGARTGLRPVIGQLLTFADFRTAWPSLDAWEEAYPDRPGLYRRVLVTVEVDGGAPTTAWTYAVPVLPSGSRELVTGEWAVSTQLPANP